MLACRVIIKVIPFVKDNLQLKYVVAFLSRTIQDDLKYRDWAIILGGFKWKIEGLSQRL